MKTLINNGIFWWDNVGHVDKASTSSFNKLNTLSLIGVCLFSTFITLTLGFNKLVIITAIIPISGFVFVYYLYSKKLYGLGIIMIIFLSLIHVSIIVGSYKHQFLEILYLLIAILPLSVLNNINLLRVFYLISYICFLLFGFYFGTYNILEISKWPVSILVYFVLMNFVFIFLFQYLITYKINSLSYRKAILKKNKEIQDQNDLIKLNTKMLVQLEKEKHEIELAGKLRDIELVHINNQLKIKMKVDLIKELQNLTKGKSDVVPGIPSIINKLKFQIEEEKRIDLLQTNIEIVGSDFNERIKQQFSDVTKSEIEMLSFVKLKLSNKQIAFQKNTSPNSVNVALHRLKNKGNFDSTNDMKSFIEEF